MNGVATEMLVTGFTYYVNSELSFISKASLRLSIRSFSSGVLSNTKTDLSELILFGLMSTTLNPSLISRLASLAEKIIFCSNVFSPFENRLK